MVGHKYVLWQIWLIIPELSLLPLLIWITVVVFMVIGSGGIKIPPFQHYWESFTCSVKGCL